ncbi:hypothetical protein [Tahibacter soli]|uniref:histidine kinase n=1 Tax=Tahibacter soli TaxID=2983605 RepID=A0A9X4BKV7_9GAMM|nr:hypothetical protein [Tahibacter soli]MDC8016093.1 hypothetical protein [Tahibacter soli]
MSEAALTGATEGTPVRHAWLDRLAHDLRSAYSPVSIGITMLRSGRLEPAQQAELLAAMQRQSETLVQMLDDISDLVASRHGAKTATSIAHLFDTVRARTAARLADAGVALDARVPAEPATLRGESRALARLLVQIVLHAAQIAGRGSRVVVDAQPRDGQPALRVTVADATEAGTVEAFAAFVARLEHPAAPHLADAAAHDILARHNAHVVALGGDAPGVLVRLAARSD